MRYHDITADDMLNGDGLRVVLWLAGCNHGCPGCQNPITWDPDGGLLFDAAAEAELFDKLDRSYISGLTLSGGDPLFPASRPEVEALLKKMRSLLPDKTVWLYTGYLWEEVRRLSLMRYVDVLVDGPYVEALCDRALHWRGSSNQRVIDVKKSLSSPETVLYCEQ